MHTSTTPKTTRSRTAPATTFAPSVTQYHDYNDRLLNREEAAHRLGLAPHTLANWSSRGIGPKVVRVGARTVRYRLSDLIAYMDQLSAVERVAS